MGCWINVWVERNATCYLARKRLSFFLFRVMMMLKKIAYEMERTRSKFSCFLNVPVKRHVWVFWHLPVIYLKHVCDCDRALYAYGEHVLIHNNTWFSFIALLSKLKLLSNFLILSRGMIFRVIILNLVSFKYIRIFWCINY